MRYQPPQLKIVTIKYPGISSLLLILLFMISMQASAAGSRREKAQESKEPVLKVKMGSVHGTVKIEFPDGGWMQNSRGKKVKTFKKKEVFSWTSSPAGKRKTRSQFNGETMLFVGNGPLMKLNTKPYRGVMQVSFSGSGAKIINHVGIEAYLRGVVGSEIGSRSPAESLKAQTVIARTYAYASRGKHGAEGADVCDSTHCQVYSGAGAERDTINAAVDGTRGIIMISDGEPIATLYHACCGGMTSDNDKVYGGAPRSYLRRVVCPFCKEGTNYRWSRAIGLPALRAALLKEKVRFNRLLNVEVESAGPMDRVDNLVLRTETGVHKVRGTTIRRLFDLPSTTFVTSGRKVQGQQVAAVKPIKPVKRTVPVPAVGKPGLMVAALYDDQNEGPQQLFIQSSAGLKRSPRPAQGWHVVGAGFPDAQQEITVEEPEAVVINNSPRANAPLDKLEIFGRGYGHQVGLCQAGAIELGKRDWSYRQILAFYYSNVALRSLDY